MNHTKVSNAFLNGYDGPFFPDLLADFMASQDVHDVHNKHSMNQVAMQIPGFEGGDVYLTSDKHYWYFGLHFKSDSGEMVILLPDFGDLNPATGRMERVRSVAVYTVGNFDTTATIELLIKGIQERGERHIQQAKATRDAEDKILGPETIATLEKRANGFADTLVHLVSAK